MKAHDKLTNVLFIEIYTCKRMLQFLKMDKTIKKRKMYSNLLKIIKRKCY